MQLKKTAHSKKLLLAMKLTAIILLSASLSASAIGHSQKVSLNMKNAPVQKVFKELVKQTGVSIICNASLLQGAKPVTINVSNATVEEVIAKCLEGLPLTYTVEGGSIVIKKKEENNVVILRGDEGLTAIPPPIDISGHVTNNAGEPLSGASVTIKRTGKGTITNANGEFSLKQVNSDDILVVSYIGYATLNIKIGERTNFVLLMNTATDKLDEIKIQAYGTTTDRLRTGNIATVTSAEIERQPVMNAIQALQGKIPGLVITQANGYASAPLKIEIRGRSVINPDLVSEPLYIVDGVPLTILNFANNYASGATGVSQLFSGPAGGQSPLFGINPADIESITVLKDADATAIYGSRGADGVIIITTKKGNAGKTKFDMSVYSGISKVTKHYALLNTQQYLSVRREALNNDGITPDIGNAFDLISWDTTRNTDWQKYLWGGTGKTTDVQMRLDGGDKLTTFRVAGAYHRETDIETVSGANERGSVQFSLSHKSLSQKLSVSFRSLYSFSRVNLISLPDAVLLPPNAPAVFDDQGHLNYNGWQPVSNQFLFSGLLQPYTANTNFLNSGLKLQYTVIKGLNISANLGYSNTHDDQIQIRPIISQDPATNPTGSSSFGNSSNTNWIIEPQLEYNTLISKGKLNAFVGTSNQSVNQNGYYTDGKGYVNDNLLGSLANAPTSTSRDGHGQYKYAAIFSRINYNWGNKYILNLSARRDGSSKFGAGKQFGNFGAAGVAWIFTEEKWLKNRLSFLSFGKLRGSYGLTGRDLIGDYGFLTRWSATDNIPYQGIPSYTPTQHANPDLRWEENRKLEAALNLGFLKDRINFEIAWYRNRCGNQLLYAPLPTMTGFGKVSENLPATVQNTGLEFNLRASLIDKNDFNWAINFNVGKNRNKLIAFPGLDQSSYKYMYVVGQSLNIKRMLHYTGVDPQTGLYTFEDKNKDGQITIISGFGNDDQYNKDLSVKYDGGFGTDLQYKGITIDLFFHFRHGELPSAIFNGFPGQFGNQSVQVLNHWQKPGDQAKFAQYSTINSAAYNNFFFSDAIYSDGSFLRLQNLSISYELPKNWIRKVGLNGCKMYFQGENLFLISNYNGLDPETPGLGALPPSKIFTTGIEFNF